MVNMNHYEDPCIYGLTYDGRVFYVGYTSVNALNRWWQHRHRARSGHFAPVYQYMRAVGIDEVGYTVLAPATNASEAKILEAQIIANFINQGVELVNQIGRDGVPDSWSDEMKSKVSSSQKGRKSWITGKRGEEAGWTEERRRKQSEKMKGRRGEPKHGTVNEYKKYQCRCEECCNAYRAYIGKRKRKSNKPVVLKHERPTPKWQIHGEVACYKNGKCRCEPCTTAYREYTRKISKTPESKKRSWQYKGDGRIDKDL